MIEYYNQKWIGKIFRGYFWGFTFWPFIWYKISKDEISPWRQNHEREHLRQQVRGLLIGYYIRWWAELLWNKFVKKLDWKEAYQNISYEVKARKAEHK